MRWRRVVLLFMWVWALGLLWDPVLGRLIGTGEWWLMLWCLRAWSLYPLLLGLILRLRGRRIRGLFAWWRLLLIIKASLMRLLLWFRRVVILLVR